MPPHTTSTARHPPAQCSALAAAGLKVRQQLGWGVSPDALADDLDVRAIHEPTRDKAIRGLVTPIQEQKGTATINQDDLGWQPTLT